MSLFSFCLLLCIFLPRVFAELSEPSSTDCYLVDITGVDKAYLLARLWKQKYRGNPLLHFPFSKKEAEIAAQDYIDEFYGIFIRMDISGDLACPRLYYIDSYIHDSLTDIVDELRMAHGLEYFYFKGDPRLVDISGLDKADLLHSLWFRSVFYFEPPKNRRAPFTREKAEQAVKKYIDYFYGAVIKTDLAGDIADSGLYDRDNGKGAFAFVVEHMRKEMTENHKKLFEYATKDD